jgi:hypothetical protein
MRRGMQVQLHAESCLTHSEVEGLGTGTQAGIHGKGQARLCKLQVHGLYFNQHCFLTTCHLSQSALDSQPKSTVGTPAYIAPEVLQRKE